jgi:YgiT-type zinc finger domain-containing protein
MGTRLANEETVVKCVICRHGETSPGKTTITLERDALTLVVKGVPAQVCENCGEAYVDEQTTAQILASAEQAARAGVQVEVREFVAA